MNRERVETVNENGRHFVVTFTDQPEKAARYIERCKKDGLKLISYTKQIL